MQLAGYARRRFVEKSPRNKAWDQLHKVADKAYPALRTLFTEAFASFREAIDWTALRELLVQGNLPEILVLLEQAWATSTDAGLRDPLRRSMQTMVTQGAVASQPALAAVLPRSARLAVTFDEASPLVLDYVRTHSATLIRGIGDETRQAIRALLVQNMQAGRSWQSLVPELQSMLGVTVKQADALVALRARLLAQGMREDPVMRLVDAKARQYKRLRARTVARHETMEAVSQGAQAQMTELIQQGVLEPSRYKKYFVLTNDDRLCPICRETKQLNSDGVGLLDPFLTPNGPYLRPPIHVTCRCVATIRAVRSLTE